MKAGFLSNGVLTCIPGVVCASLPTGREICGTRRRPCLHSALKAGLAATVLLIFQILTASAQITQIIDATGDGAGKVLSSPSSIAVDGTGNVYVIGWNSKNAFKITPAGAISEIIDATGDGAGKILSAPRSIAVDGADNVYVAGYLSGNAFKITPAGVITEIIDATGDGAGKTLGGPSSIVVDGAGNAYVTGIDSDNAFKITPAGVITEIIDATGDGAGKILAAPRSIAVDGADNVYVLGSQSAFKITPAGAITEIINATGDGAGKTLDSPSSIVVDGADNVYVAGSNSNNAFKITPAGVITEIIDATGDGAGKTLDDPSSIVVDGAGNVYVVGWNSNNAFKITPAGVITQIIDTTGDGAGNALSLTNGIVVDDSGNVYVTGEGSTNAFKIVIPNNLDYGDAPDTGAGTGTGNYKTTLADDGARHTDTGPKLGATRDIESDGQPTVGADGDGDDEDGVSFLTTSIYKASVSTQVGIEVVASAAAKLDAWVDFNQDGSWLDAGEHVLNAYAVVAGTNILSITIPASVLVGTTYARFRLTSAGVAPPTGPAPDGEVEDYKLTVTAQGGHVTIRPSTGRGNPITISRTGADTRVTDSGGNLLYQGPIADGNDVTIKGTPGTDKFVLDLSGGNPFPGGTLLIDGAGGSGDILYLAGGPVTTVTYMSLNNTDGSVTVVGPGINGTLNYVNLAPIVDPVIKAFEVHTFGGGLETIVLKDDPANGTDTSFIDSDMAEAVTFFNPTASITVNAGTGDDKVTLESLDPAITTPLVVINGDTGDDAVSLTPSKVFEIEANGNTHTSGDRLTIDMCSLTGLTTTHTPGAPGSGVYTFSGGYKKITYTTFESVSLGFEPKTPLHTQTGISIEPTFTWDYGAGFPATITGYTIEIDTQADFLSGNKFTIGPITPTTLKSYTVDFDTDGFKLKNNTTYYWRITAPLVSGGGIIQCAGTREFLSVLGVVPELTYPKPDLTIPSPTFNFSWNTASPIGGLKFLIEVDGPTFDPTDGLDGGTATTTSTMLASSNIAGGFLGGGNYTWRVTVMTSDGRVVAISNMQAFSILGGAVVPTPSYPIDNLIVYTTNPTLCWYPGVGTANLNYEVAYAEKALSFTTFQTSKTCKQVTSLKQGVTYTWKVRSRVGTGAWSAYSPLAEFIVGVGLPPAPVANFGGTGVTVLTLQPKLEWLVEGDPGEIASFGVEWSRDASFVSVDGARAGLARTEYALTSAERLVLGATYHWRVNATLTDGSQTSWSDERANAIFTTASESESLVPQLTAGTGGTLMNGSTAILTWKVPGPGTRVSYYEIVYADRESFAGATRIMSVNPTLSIRINSLAPGAIYYWKVRSFDGTDYSAFSATETFVVDPGDGPVVPVPGSPAYGAQLESILPEFSWFLPARSSAALKYDLDVSRSEDFSSARTVTSISSINYAGLTLSPGTYYWRVRSHTASGRTSSYSSTARFEITGSATGVASEPGSELPEEYRITAVYPNPFSHAVTIEYTIPTTSRVSISIFNSLGQQVKNLVDGEVIAGLHRALWNGAGEAGSTLPNGVYFFRFQARDYLKTGALVMVR